MPDEEPLHECGYCCRRYDLREASFCSACGRPEPRREEEIRVDLAARFENIRRVHSGWEADCAEHDGCRVSFRHSGAPWRHENVSRDATPSAKPACAARGGCEVKRVVSSDVLSRFSCSASTVTLALLGFMEMRSEWKGTTGDLFEALRPAAPQQAAEFPATAAWLGRRLSVLRRTLPGSGLVIEYITLPGHSRGWRIEKRSMGAAP
jgi:hypothetical protein